MRKLLQITKGNVTHAARMAGRNRTEFYKLLSPTRAGCKRFQGMNWRYVLRLANQKTGDLFKE
ncbi:hypothetical protein ACNKHT_16540 [Shigella flexneri]